MPKSVVAGTNRIDYLYSYDGQKRSSSSGGSSTYYRGVGGAVAKMAGTIGFAGGAVTGAAGGFAGGFAGGATSAWLNGAGFGQGLGAGLKSGAMGAATGALMGGIAGGRAAQNAGGNFWTGYGATSDFTVSGSFDDSIIETKIDHNNRSARDFYNEHPGLHSEGWDSMYANPGSIPRDPRYSITPNRHVLKTVNGRQVEVLGTTVRTSTGCDVYLYRGAFTSREMLYTVMGHEMIHVRLYTAGIHDSASHEATTWRWTNIQSRRFGLSSIYNGSLGTDIGNVMRQYYPPFKTTIK